MEAAAARRRRRRRWSFFASTADPATRIHQLYCDLILLVVPDSDDDRDESLSPPRRGGQQANGPFSWRRARAGAHSALPPAAPAGSPSRMRASDDVGRPDSELSQSPRRQRSERAAASFRGVLEVASSDEDAGDNNEAGTTHSPQKTAKSKVASSLPHDAWEDLEAALVETIREIGTLLVESQPKHSASSNLRGDPVFEYFCEAGILPVLVDIALEKPSADVPLSSSSAPSSRVGLQQVAWSPAVKAQVLESMSLLVSSLRDKSALYFVLSHNSINRLISCPLPLQQWTEQAAHRIVPAYVDLLKTLTLQLAAYPHLFPCFLDEPSQPTPTGAPDSLPLLTGLLETAAFGYSQSDSAVHATCLNLLVNLLRIAPVHRWASNQQQHHQHQRQLLSSAPLSSIGSDEKKQEESPSDAEGRDSECAARLLLSPAQLPPQACLASHLTLLFSDRFERLVALTEGPVVSTARSTALAGQLSVWNHQIDLLNDVLGCDVSSWNVRVCETILRGFVSKLLLSLDGSDCGAHVEGGASPPRKMLLGRGADVGVMDADVLPEPEARAQVATLAFMLLFDRLDYSPLVRMLAVAVFHPYTTDIWKGVSLPPQAPCGTSVFQYLVTPALNRIVQGDAQNQVPDRDNYPLPNPFRQGFLNALQGDYGEYRFIPTAMLAEASMKALDQETLNRLSILEPLGDALSKFLERHHQLKSAVSAVAVRSAAVLAVHLIYAFNESGEGSVGCARLYSHTHLALQQARDYFFQKTMETHHVMGVSELFVDLVESAVLAYYKRTTLPITEASGPVVPAFVLSRYGSGSFPYHESLIRKMRGVNRNDVEATRFYAEMAIFYRACCRLVDRYVTQRKSTALSSKSILPHQQPEFDSLDKADELALIFSSLSEKPDTGTVLDLRGRMSFPFTLSTGVLPHDQTSDSPDGSRSLSEERMLRGSSRLILVLDPMDMSVLKPVPRSNGTRATMICCVPLLSIIAAAADHAWLHVAVKHSDLGFLIKNGNMALHFESAGTCLIVRQYLERSRQVLRAEMAEKIKVLFQAPPTAGRPDGESSRSE